MSALRTVWFREARTALWSPTTYIALTSYLLLVAAFFAAALSLVEAERWSLAVRWCLSAALPLPLLCIMSTMRLFAAERANGTLPSLLTTVVVERDILMGKYFAALGIVFVGVAGALIPWLLLGRALGESMPPLSQLLLPLLLLGLQALSWSALGLLASVIARHPWEAALGAFIAAFCAIIAWGVASHFLAALRWNVPMLPLLLECFDAAAGRLTLHSLVWHLSLSWWLLFTATRLLEARRWH